MKVKTVNKRVIWGVLALPGLLFLAIPLSLGMWGEKTWKTLLIHSGFITLSMLVFSLLLTPLSRMFSRLYIFKVLSRFRREIGLSVFLYVCIHLFSYLMRSIEKRGWVDPKYIFHPVIFPGVCAFLILFFLALTSNNWSVKKLGYQKWKRLHSLIYVGEVGVFIHVVQKSVFYACIIILPLVFLQLLNGFSSRRLR